MKSIRSVSRRLFTATAVSVALATSQTTLAANEQLEFVPDDTLFYVGTGKPISAEDFSAMLPGFFNADALKKMAPGIDELEGREQVFEFLSDFAEDPAEFTRRWGLGEELQFSVYTVGLMPVFRIAGDMKQFETVLDKIDAEKEIKFDQLTHEGIQVRISPFESEEEKPAEVAAPTSAELQSAESELASIKEESSIATETLQSANDSLDAAKAGNDASGIAEAANEIAAAASEISKISKRQADAELALARLEQQVTDAEGGPGGGKSSAGLIIAAGGNDLIFSFSPNAYDPDLLNQLLGLEKPDESLEATGKLKNLRKEWGYGEEMAMFVDFKLLADAITGGESRAAQQLQTLSASDEFMDSSLQPFSAEPCKGEIRQMAANWPMMVTGNRRFEVGDETINFDSHFAMLLENVALRDTLKLFRGLVPTSQSNSNAMASFGVGLDIDSAPQLSAQLTEFISSVKYDCEPLKMLNKINQTDISAASMGAMMFSGMARGVKGFSVNVYDTDINMESRIPVKNLDAAIAVSADDPGALLQTLQLLPQMNALSDLPLDGTAVSLNELLPIPTPEGVEIFAAVKDKSIVFFSGDQAKDFAGRLGGNGEEGFISSSLNTEMIIEKINAVVESLPEAVRSEEKLDPLMGYLQTYPLGNLSYKIDFTDKGIELDSIYEIARPPK